MAAPAQRHHAPGEERADVVVVGGGHNGLVCAAYLAKRGLDVCVVEQNNECGGALFSTRADGVVLEHGGIDHSTILASSIPEELELARHGLDYVERRASAMHLFGDGVRIAIAETAEETAASIAAVDTADADAWIELATLSAQLWELIGPLSEGRAGSIDALSRAGRLTLGRRGRALVELATMPVTELARQWFRTPHMRALAAFRSQFSGLPATHPGTGAVFCLTPGGHGRRFGRPAGGSRAFVDALESAIVGAGGSVKKNFRTTKVTRDAEGWRVSAGDGREMVAPTVVSAVPPQDMILDLVKPPAVVPDALRARMERVDVTISNLSQFTLAASLARQPPLAGIDGTGYEGAQLWMLGEPEDFLAHQAATAAGRIADRPAVLATFPSVLDATAAPAERASLWANGFIAHKLRGDRPWGDAAEEAVEKIWVTIDSCLPGVRDAVTCSAFTSPDDLTRRTGAVNPGMHLATTLEQSFAGRPAPGSANHRSGIGGLYLTGAGTNPGPGISGLPGRACAEAILSDLGSGGPLGRARAALGAGRRELSRMRRLTGAGLRARRG